MRISPRSGILFSTIMAYVACPCGRSDYALHWFKGTLLEDIYDIISEEIKGPIETVGDLFSGSGVVSQFFKRKGYKVISNDLMCMSYVIARGYLDLNTAPTFSGLNGMDVFSYLNGLREPEESENSFVFKNFSPNEASARMYFQPGNAKKIDAIRQQIELWFSGSSITENEYFYLLTSLLLAVPYISNIAGVYAAYLKHWDARTYKSLYLEPVPIVPSRYQCEAFCMDAAELCKLKKFDLVYIDPPYNQRQYSPNYHVLETIARYDSPALHGVTGMRDYERSDFCIKGKVKNAFQTLFKNLQSKYAIVSYNNEGLLSTIELTDLLSNYGKVKLKEIPYRRYKSKIPNNSKGLKEQLYFVDMR